MIINTVWLVVVDLFLFVVGRENIDSKTVRTTTITTTSHAPNSTNIKHQPESKSLALDHKDNLLPTVKEEPTVHKFSINTFISPVRLLEKTAHSTSEKLTNNLNTQTYLSSDSKKETLLEKQETASEEEEESLPLIELVNDTPLSLIESTTIETSETVTTLSNSNHFDLVPAVMYIQNPDGTNCFVGPQQDFDCVITRLEYGNAVTVVGFDGRYAKINKPSLTGYILKEDLTPVKTSVWPVFLDQKTYDADNLETIKTRHLIKDIFFTDSLNLPLQAGEYIVARLFSEHRIITWSHKRPRLAGSWQSLLKGRPGIHISIKPKTDSIMEWVNSNGEGRLAYVEAVSPEKNLTLTAVGVDKEAHFTIMLQTEAQWHELRPVFIEVT